MAEIGRFSLAPLISTAVSDHVDIVKFNATETATQLDSRDTNNRSRANHTGTQLATTISDLTSRIKSDETTTTLALASNILSYTAEDGVVTQVDLSPYLDDTQVIVNNTLTSTSTTEALSAVQGKTLKDTQDTQQTAIDLNTAKVSNVTTDLSHIATVDSLTIKSSDGADTVIAAASSTIAGVMTTDMFDKLSGIEVSAKDDQLASEVPVVASGNLSSSTVQLALEELQDDIDTINTTLNNGAW